jgi:hypothetical protein
MAISLTLIVDGFDVIGQVVLVGIMCADMYLME